MKKINILFYVIGTICFLVAGYIIYNEYFLVDEIAKNFNEEEELAIINDKLTEVGSPLGWIIVTDSIDNKSKDGKYNVSFNKDLLKSYSNRQLFVMEYILSYNNYDDFIVLDMEGNVIEEEPTSDFTSAYMKYDKYNEYYKDIFGKDYDINKGMKGNSSYDKEYVYYSNRRGGSNGIYIPMIKADSVKYDDGEFIADVTITYSTGASDRFGAKDDKGLVVYTKNIDGDIYIKSFSLKDR